MDYVAPADKASRPLTAIFFILSAGFVNTVMLSAIKQLADSLHPFEIAFFRCVIGFLVLLPLVWRGGGWTGLKTEQFGLHMVRSGLNAGGMLLFFLALSLSSLVTVSAIGFAAPLFATLMAIVFLKETVGLRRWMGLLIGFAGTLIILRPGTGFMELGALAALISSAMWAGSMITIKHLTVTESPLAITTWAALLVGVFCFVPALFYWQWPTLEQWGWLILIGSLGSVIQYCLAKAFSLADTSVVLPFDFMKLVWASLFGFVLFSELPDLFALLGGSLILGSAVYIAYRERRAEKHLQ